MLGTHCCSPPEGHLAGPEGLKAVACEPVPLEGNVRRWAIDQPGLLAAAQPRAALTTNDSSSPICTPQERSYRKNPETLIATSGRKLARRCLPATRKALPVSHQGQYYI